MVFKSQIKIPAARLLIVCLAALPACTSTKSFKASGTQDIEGEQARVLLMPPLM